MSDSHVIPCDGSTSSASNDSSERIASMHPRVPPMSVLQPRYPEPMGIEEGPKRQRPWTVTVVVVAAGVGLLLGQLFGTDRDLIYYLASALWILLLVGLWFGRAWAYGPAIAITAIGLLGWGVWVVTQVQSIPSWWSIVAFILGIATLVLLRDPATKAFVTGSREARPQLWEPPRPS